MRGERRDAARVIHKPFQPCEQANPHPERPRRTLLWFDVPAPGESASDLTSLEEREERLANNAIVFRTVNEEIEQVALRLGGDNYEFICECSTRGCFERVVLSRREYEHVRSEGVRFFVAPGHENPEVELVVETNPTYLIVEKDGHAGTVAEAADPRDGDPELSV